MKYKVGQILRARKKLGIVPENKSFSSHFTEFFNSEMKNKRFKIKCIFDNGSIRVENCPYSIMSYHIEYTFCPQIEKKIQKILKI